MENKNVFDAVAAEEFKQSVASDESRQSFAAAMALPIQKEVTPVSSVRNIFQVENLAPGAQASYPLDMGSVSAWVMPAVGGFPQNIVEGEELFVPTYTIDSSVEWKMQYARDGRYDVAGRAKEKLLNAIVTKEETDGWAIIRAAATAARTVTVAGGTTLSKALLNAMFIKMAQTNGMKIDVIFCSPTRFGDIREWSETTIDPVTQREIWTRGGLTEMWGAKIFELPTLADNEVYGFDTRYFGVMPVRETLQTRDNPISILKLRVGVIAWEELGFVALESRSIVKGTI